MVSLRLLLPPELEPPDDDDDDEGASSGFAGSTEDACLGSFGWQATTAAREATWPAPRAEERAWLVHASFARLLAIAARRW